ncbi:gas vesicle protein [Streptomyces klenkii]|uniref:gas vesicle protein n=1 Tax=Streptomyces klenkii TaxID=1420899 RepID=UPI0018F4CBF0|nr:gas vesicle protein [Streptomyces klenkii]
MTGDGLLVQRRLSLVDLLDRLLAGGVVVAGDLTLRIADVDLIRINLHALISSIDDQVPSPWESWEPRESWVSREEAGA